MPAVLNKSTERRAPEEGPAFDTAPKIPEWKRPPMEPSLLTRLREILGLGMLDELPEELYLTIGLQMALDRYFTQTELSYKEMCALVLQSAIYPVPQPGQKIKTGYTVLVKSMNARGIYICRALYGRDLVNMYGTWMLHRPEDIEVADEGVPESELNRHAARGRREEEYDKLPRAATVPELPKDLPALPSLPSV